MNGLAAFVDSCFVVNLDRRPERLAQFKHEYPTYLPRPVKWSATDGLHVSPPAWWRGGRGPWATTQSHVGIFDRCLRSGIQSILVFEDDALPAGEFFAYELSSFLAELPDDWQWLYLGGNLDGAIPRAVSEHVYAPRYVLGSHAYAVRGPMIATLHGLLIAPEAYVGIDHWNDQAFARFQRCVHPPGLYAPAR